MGAYSREISGLDREEVDWWIEKYRRIGPNQRYFCSIIMIASHIDYNTAIINNREGTFEHTLHTPNADLVLKVEGRNQFKSIQIESDQLNRTEYPHI